MGPCRQVVGQRIGADRHAVQAPETTRNRDQHSKRQQESRQSEQQQDDIRDPGPKPPPKVVDGSGRDRVRESRIVPAVGQQNDEQRHGDQGANNPARLGQQACQARISGGGGRLA